MPIRTGASTGFLQTLEGNDELGQRWNELVFQMETPQVFFTYEWALAVERAFKSTLHPQIFLTYKEGKLLGIAALALQESKPTEMVFLCGTTADYCDVVSAPADRVFVIANLLDSLHRAGVQKLSLASVPSESSTLLALRSAKGHGYRSFMRPAYECSRIVLNKQADGVAPKTADKKRTQERLRRLLRLGPLKLVHLRSQKDASEAMNSIVSAQISRFLATQRLSPLLHADRRQFFSELTSLLSQNHWLDVSVLYAGENAVAWNFGFQFADVLFWYLPTFDFSINSLSPGACLLNLLIAESQNEKQVKEIDLGLGDEKYKSQVANAQRATLNATLSSSFFQYIALLSRNWLARLAKASGFLETVFRTILGWVAGLRREIRRRNTVALFGVLLRHFLLKIYSREEIIFLEWDRQASRKQRSTGSLEPIDWKVLAQAALENNADSSTLKYLQRCALRLKKSEGKVRGYALRSPAGSILHLCWIRDFSGFEMNEIQYQLPLLANAQMIFDCWTPEQIRGSHHFATAVECIAEQLHSEGMDAWIFSALRNYSSLKALRKSAFVPRYSLNRSRMIFRMPVEKCYVSSTAGF